MRVLGLIPARGGSQRVERKNLMRLGGRTLVRRALDTALASGALDLVVLSSEDDDILAEAADLDGVVAMKRPAELATATARTYDVVMHVLAGLRELGHGEFDAVAIVQCTSPFTAPGDVAGTVGLLERTGAESAVSVVQLDYGIHPLKMKVLKDDRLEPWLEDDAMTPSHELPRLWIRNGSVYVTRRDVVERGELVSARDCRGYEMPGERSHDIDTPLDLAFAEFLIESGRAG